jgi:hypothetical protein
MAFPRHPFGVDAQMPAVRGRVCGVVHRDWNFSLNGPMDPDSNAGAVLDLTGIPCGQKKAEGTRRSGWLISGWIMCEGPQVLETDSSARKLAFINQCVSYCYLGGVIDRQHGNGRASDVGQSDDRGTIPAEMVFPHIAPRVK